MGRPKRAADGGLIYHVLNRANTRTPIFDTPEDCAHQSTEIMDTDKTLVPIAPWLKEATMGLRG